MLPAPGLNNYQYSSLFLLAMPPVEYFKTISQNSHFYFIHNTSLCSSNFLLILERG